MQMALSGPASCPSVLSLVVVPRCHCLGQLSAKMGGIGKHMVDGWQMGGGNITNSLKSPWFVQNVAFHLSPSFIRTLLNPHWTSSLVKYLAPLSLLMSLKMRGSEYLFLTVIAFRAQ